MDKWTTLETELDAVLDNMTAEDWANWEVTRVEKKRFRRMQQEIDAILHFSKLSMQNGNNSLKVNTEEDKSELLNYVNITDIIVTCEVENTDTNNYAMAA